MKNNIIMNLDTEFAREAIKSQYEPSVQHKNFFNATDIDYIWKYAFQNGKPRTNIWNKTIFVTNNYNDIIFSYKNQIDSILPDPKIYYGGNFFITTIGYGYHTDSYPKPTHSVYGNCVPWRNILIPLWSDGDGGKITFYKNRYPTWSVSGTKGAKGLYTEMNDLKIENEFVWEPGSVYVFDSCQLHNSTKTENDFTIKMGLLIKFVREVM